MRNCYKRLGLAAILSCSVLVSTAQTVTIDSIITAESLKALVQTFAADSFQGRLTASIHAGKAALLISDLFKQAGALPIAGTEGYIMPFELPGTAQFNFKSPNKAQSWNVVAALPGRSRAKEIVIFSAHFDHVGTESESIAYKVKENGKPEQGDVIYNGANDNASGVSGLIHLARYYAQQRNNERTLVFIAFSGEELGLLGSKHLAPSFDPKAVTAVVNMDMIGRPISESKKYPFITGYGESNLRGILNERLNERAPQYGPRYFHIDPFVNENLYKRSDNYPFAQRGMVAHTILTCGPTDDYYHSLNDEWETLDYPFMAEVVKAIALATNGLAEGIDTPR